MRGWFLLLSFALATSPGASVLADPVSGEEALFGLVIGSNTTHDEDIPPLRYADDDAVQNATLLTQLGAQVVLLTTFDAETKSLHESLDPVSPTRAAVFTAMETLNEAMGRARTRGQTPIFYFFYSGHGDVKHNQGFVRLADDELWRQDLVNILKESRAETNHVIIDACKSYFMVYERGAGGSRERIKGVIDLDDENVPKNTGVFLSTSSATDSHEWEAYESGIFSHEIRSALRGAADIDLSGTISYTEAAAFIWTANSSIANRRFRPEFISRPPAEIEGSSAVLARVKDAKGDRLLLGPGVGHHAYIEDDKGLRLADFHPADSQQLVLLLPTRRPLFFRRPGSDEEYELPPGREVHLASITARKRTVLKKGAEHIAFRKLFERAFRIGSITNYQNRPEPTLMAKVVPRDLTWLRRSLGLSSVAFAVVGGTLTGVAAAERNDVDSQTSGLERQAINERIGKLNIGAITCYALAGVAFGSYLIWTLWPEEKVAFTVIAHDGAGLELSVRF